MRRDPLGHLNNELEALKNQRLYRHLRILSDEQKARTTVDGRHVVNLSSNNYLGLTTHPKLRERSLDAIHRYGVGAGSVRPIAGTLAIHMELEQRLAEFKKTEAVVVFQSGFAANAGTVSAVLTKDDVVISDELNHASIIDGCRLVDQGVPSQRRLRGPRDSHGAAGVAAQASHHRRRVQHGR
jgi:glycine C-acetyltransferase